MMDPFLLVLLTYWTTSFYKNTHVQAIQSELSSTNAYYNGQLDAKATEIRGFEKTLADEREQKRQQEAFNQRLLTEKTSLDEQLAYFHSLPQNVLTLYSNLTSLASNQPNELHLLTEAFTNLIHGMEAERPRFQVIANGTLLKPLTIVPLNQSRSISFSIANLSEVTAEQLSVHFEASISGTNWIAEHWVTIGARGRMSENGFEPTAAPLTFYSFIADKPLAGNSSFFTTPLTLKTNFQTLRMVDVLLTVYSSKSKNHTYNIILEIPPISQ